MRCRRDLILGSRRNYHKPAEQEAYLISWAGPQPNVMMYHTFDSCIYWLHFCISRALVRLAHHYRRFGPSQRQMNIIFLRDLTPELISVSDGTFSKQWTRLDMESTYCAQSSYASIGNRVCSGSGCLICSCALTSPPSTFAVVVSRSIRRLRKSLKINGHPSRCSLYRCLRYDTDTPVTRPHTMIRKQAAWLFGFLEVNRIDSAH